MSERERNLTNHDLLKQRANIVKALQYHQNQFSRLSERLREVEVLLDSRGVPRSPIAQSVAWVLKELGYSKEEEGR